MRRSDFIQEFCIHAPMSVPRLDSTGGFTPYYPTTREVVGCAIDQADALEAAGVLFDQGNDT